MVCTPRWGTMPSAELKLPPDMAEPRAPRIAAAAGAVTPTGSGAVAARARRPRSDSATSGTASTRTGARYCSGSKSTKGDNLTAVYAIGPSIDNKHDAVWTRRKGRVAEDGFVFQETGKSTLQVPPAPGWRALRRLAVGRRQDLDDRLLKPIDPAC